MTQPPSSSQPFTIGVEEGQYYIEGARDRQDPWPASDDALTTGEDTWIAVITGTQWGPVTVDLQVLDGPPPLESGWDMVAERDVLCPSGTLFLSSPFTPGQRSIESRAGRHRVRIHVRDRATASPHNILESPLETHLIQIWRNDTPQPTRTLAGPDEYARHYS